jgi:hypothetical protein
MRCHAVAPTPLSGEATNDLSRTGRRRYRRHVGHRPRDVRVLLAEGVGGCADAMPSGWARSEKLPTSTERTLLAVRCDVLMRTIARLGSRRALARSLRSPVSNAGQARMSTFAETTDAAWMEVEAEILQPDSTVRVSAVVDASDAPYRRCQFASAYQPEPHMVHVARAQACRSSQISRGSLPRAYA